VVNTNGRLGGYIGGKKTKQKLLELEKEIKKTILTIKKSKK